MVSAMSDVLIAIQDYLQESYIKRLSECFHLCKKKQQYQVRNDKHDKNMHLLFQSH